MSSPTVTRSAGGGAGGVGFGNNGRRTSHKKRRQTQGSFVPHDGLDGSNGPPRPIAAVKPLAWMTSKGQVSREANLAQARPHDIQTGRSPSLARRLESQHEDSPPTKKFRSSEPGLSVSSHDINGGAIHLRTGVASIVSGGKRSSLDGSSRSFTEMDDMLRPGSKRPRRLANNGHNDPVLVALQSPNARRIPADASTDVIHNDIENDDPPTKPVHIEFRRADSRQPVDEARGDVDTARSRSTSRPAKGPAASHSAKKRSHPFGFETAAWSRSDQNTNPSDRKAGNGDAQANTQTPNPRRSPSHGAATPPRQSRLSDRFDRDTGPDPETTRGSGSGQDSSPDPLQQETANIVETPSGDSSTMRDRKISPTKSPALVKRIPIAVESKDIPKDRAISKMVTPSTRSAGFLRTWNIKAIFDGRAASEGKGSLQYVQRLNSYKYNLGDLAGTFEADMFDRSVWSETHAQFHGPYDVSKRSKAQIHIIFFSAPDCKAFRANLTQKSHGGALRLDPHDEVDERMERTFNLAIKKHKLLESVDPAREMKEEAPTRHSDRLTGAGPTCRSTVKLRDGMRGEPEQSEAPGRLLRRSRNSTATSLVDRSDIPPASKGQSGSPPPRGALPALPFSQTGKLGEKWKKHLTYPPNSTNRNVATVEWHDLERLDEEEFLNDNLIFFGLRWYMEHAAPAVSDQVYCFNTYFYNSLTQGLDRGINYDAVKRWTTKARLSKSDIFQYNYIVVPINENCHWYLAIICNANNFNFAPAFLQASSSPPARSPLTSARPRVDGADANRPGNGDANQKPLNSDVKISISEGDDPSVDAHKGRGAPPPTDQESAPAGTSEKTEVAEGGPDGSGAPTSTAKKTKLINEPVIIMLDSMSLTHPAVIRNLKEYIAAEANEKKSSSATPPRGLTARCIPTQLNFSDCGLYLLAYYQKFLEDPADFVAKIVERRMDSKKDWPDFGADQLRDLYRQLVLNEGRKQNGLATTDEDGGVDLRGSTVAVPNSTDFETEHMSPEAKEVLHKAEAAVDENMQQSIGIVGDEQRAQPRGNHEEESVRTLLPGLELYEGLEQDEGPIHGERQTLAELTGLPLQKLKKAASASPRSSKLVTRPASPIVSSRFFADRGSKGTSPGSRPTTRGKSVPSGF